MREDERGCTASGTGVEVDGASGSINGSEGGGQPKEWAPTVVTPYLVLIGKMPGKSSANQS